MGIKKLKKENEHLNLSLIDIFSTYDKSKTKKYTQFLVKVINQQLKDYQYGNEDKKENLIIKLMEEVFFTSSRLSMFSEFCEMMDKGVVIEKDISKYKTWDMLEEQYLYAKHKQTFQKSKKQIKVLHDDGYYLMFKPLSYLASCTYGYKTKWCTAMINEPSYFYSHSRDGSLIYLIDKLRNKKFAFYCKINYDSYEFQSEHDRCEFTVWNEKDHRIDSLQTELPYDILMKISTHFKEDVKSKTPNYKLFSDLEMIQMINHVTIFDQPEVEMTIERTVPQFRVRRRSPRYINEYPIATPEPSIDLNFDGAVFQISQLNDDLP
jgi:hypothetical protein